MSQNTQSDERVMGLEPNDLNQFADDKNEQLTQQEFQTAEENQEISLMD